jgi:hypothetical protein
VVCFEKYVSGEAISKNSFGNYCLKNNFRCLKSEKSFEKVCNIGTIFLAKGSCLSLCLTQVTYNIHCLLTMKVHEKGVTSFFFFFFFV